jgi:hypothetical protein
MGRMGVARTHKGRKRWLAAGIACLLAAVVGVHLYSLSLEAHARDASASLTERARAATLATRIEPWSGKREVTAAIVEAQSLAAAGRVDDAYFLLLPLSRTVRDDQLFRETYQEVVAQKWALDARKAHQQHAKEKEDGALEPDDVFK